MSEDIKDIIEILELAKEEIENNDENITATLDLQDLKSLKNLYDLYNKEKDLNNELQIRYKIEHEKYLKEKEKNKELENADLTTVYMNGFYDGEKKWKDKIKEKILDLKDNNNGDNYSLTNVVMILQELLEERN